MAPVDANRSNAARRPGDASRGSVAADVVHDAGDWSAFATADAIVAAAVAALNSERDEVGEAAARQVVVALSDDQSVRRLNRDFRGVDKPTNVLSFPAAGDAGGPHADPPHLGDVVLAVETLRREADELGVEPDHHLAHIVVHGILHLLGYDHESEADAVGMERLETAVLARLGIADPYDDRAFELSQTEARHTVPPKGL